MRVFITGANRGVGLALVRACLQQSGTQVMATCRQPAEAHELAQLREQYPDRLHMIALDVTDEAAYQPACSAALNTMGGIDVLVNNAGINPRIDPARKLGQLQAATLNEVIYTNAVAPLLLTQALLPALRKGNQARIIMVSSQMGSLGRDSGGGGYAYRMSKAAMNMAARSLAGDLRAEGMTVITLHPGWVQTDMGGKTAEITPEDSANGLLALIARLTSADSGKFYKWNGEEHVW
jgi:NAD(P)-dependent dehydrogenase (short-subunit alcohol dehydrogenase family)